MTIPFRGASIAATCLLASCVATEHGAGIPHAKSVSRDEPLTILSPPAKMDNCPQPRPQPTQIIILELAANANSTFLEDLVYNSLICNQCVRIADSNGLDDEMTDVVEGPLSEPITTVSGLRTTPFDIDLTPYPGYILIKVLLSDGLSFYTKPGSNTNSDWAVTPGVSEPGMFSCLSKIRGPSNAQYVTFLAHVPSYNSKLGYKYGGINIGILTTQPAVGSVPTYLPIYLDPNIKNNG